MSRQRPPYVSNKPAPLALASISIMQLATGELKITHNCTPIALIGLLSQIINQTAMIEFQKQQMIIDPNGPPKVPNPLPTNTEREYEMASACPGFVATTNNPDICSICGSHLGNHPEKKVIS